MTDKPDPRESHPIPDAKFDPKALKDVPAVFETAGYGVHEWCPTKDGSGPPEAVCFVHEFGGQFDGLQFMTRFKSRKEVNRLIKLLERHRDNVWPV